MVQIDGYEFPDDLLYDREHNWARIEGDRATIGMSDFGQELAGEILYAEVPRVGRTIAFGEPYTSIESGKWVGRIKSPVSGEIVEANEEIEWGTVINEDPYGEGWIARVKLIDFPERDQLMKPTDPAFAAFIAAEREKHGK